jgi:hypothetical protein
LRENVQKEQKEKENPGINKQKNRWIIWAQTQMECCTAMKLNQLQFHVQIRNRILWWEELRRLKEIL